MAEPHGRRGRPDTRAIGRRGEVIAARWLEAHGLRILARNVHLRHAELDLIALDGADLCFVEVRLRSSDRYGGAAASVDARKQRRMARAARAWLASNRAPPHRRLRFDVVAIDASAEPPRVDHLRDAFTLG